MDFNKLKRASKNSIKTIQKAVQEQSKPSYTDDRFWKLSKDKAGNGSAIIRFLPLSPHDDDLPMPWILVWKHSFQGPTGLWYIEKSLTTLGQKDPVSEYNTSLWQTGDESKRDIARKQKRMRKYVANILVVKDPANPENNGKVKLFEFGQKIYEMIEDKLDPKDDPIEGKAEPVDVFNLWEGCNFKIRIAKSEGQFHYSKSEFAPQSPVADNDEEIEAIWKQEFSLSDLIDPKQFKSYDELKARFDLVIGNAVQKTSEQMPQKEPEPFPENDMPYLKETETKSKDEELNMDEMEELLNSLGDDV